MTSNYSSIPLYVIFGRVVAIWTLANIGYYLILPSLGFSLSYNTSPFAIALYFFLWICITIYFFWDIFLVEIKKNTSIWIEIFQSFALVCFYLTLVYFFSKLPALDKPLPPYPDLFFASALYFLPKSVEILVQQLLIAVMVLVLSSRFQNLKSIVLGFATTFGGAHIALYVLNNSAISYSILMTLSAFLSSLIFPYLILRVQNGFIYSYLIHFLFYFLLATFFHIFPPPGYLA
ncbi:MAG: hypothetical protein WAX44_02735 [Minisyncoccia bacterium]